MPSVRVSIRIHSHTPRITRVHYLLCQLQKRLSHKCPAGIEYCRRTLDSVPILPLHLLHHGFHALAVRDIGRYTNCFPAGLIDSVDDGIVGIWVAGEKSDGIGGGEFAGNCCSGLSIEISILGGT